MMGITRGFLEKFFSRKTEVALKAPLASPAFTGTPTAPTQENTTNNTSIATTSFVKTIAGGTSIPAVSKVANGYMKLANGIIIQWGDSGSASSVTFPIAFPTACRSVQITFDDMGAGGTFYSGYLSADARSTTGFSYGYSSTSTRTWFAIGY